MALCLNADLGPYIIRPGCAARVTTSSVLWVTSLSCSCCRRYVCADTFRNLTRGFDEVPMLGAVEATTTGGAQQEASAAAEGAQQAQQDAGQLEAAQQQQQQQATTLAEGAAGAVAAGIATAAAEAAAAGAQQ